MEFYYSCLQNCWVKILFVWLYFITEICRTHRENYVWKKISENNFHSQYKQYLNIIKSTIAEMVNFIYKKEI